ncbi:alpha/beta-hydrolase [Trametes meyenii]|nr:alpha/beta-hydrolase [Trametes meyenii]
MGLLLWRYQPFKGLYLVYIILVTLFFRVPIWSIRFLLRTNRPRRSWSLSRCIRVMTYRELTSVPVKLGLNASRPVPKSDAKLKNARVVWIEGLTEKSAAFCGEIRRAAEYTGVKPARVPAYWFFRRGVPISEDLRAKVGEKTVLHIHGGAFHLGSAHPDASTANIAHGLLAFSERIERVLAVDYRLSAAKPDPPANPYPAAILDCIAAYRYLVNEAGFAPQNITVAGDSAGGNLAFALVRHLVENGIPGLPRPGRLLSLSSWLDLSTSRTTPGSSLVDNAATDIFSTSPTARFGEYAVEAYMGPLDRGEAKTNRYLSPSSMYIDPMEPIYRGFPRTFISAGDAEKILDDSTVAMGRLKENGADVTVDIVPDAIHDFMVFKWHEPERTAALKRVCKWLDSP